jgi:DNA (cytosine-5)-methyltransferase 1
VFVVASARDDINPTEILFEFEGLRRDTAPSRKEGQRIAPCVTNGPPFSRTGNERVEAEAMVIVDCGVEITGPLSARDYKDPGTDGLNKISAKMIPVINPTFALQGAGATSQSSQGSGWNEEVQFTLNTLDVHGVAQPIAFEPGKMKRLGYGVDESGIAPVLRAEAGDNQLAVAYNIAPGKGELKHDIHVTDAHVSKTIDASGSNPSMHQGGAAIVQTMAVRRLTPTECERLQGFPDGYTNIPWRKAAESPDGPRYKALGNSWAVPVVAWLGQRIKDQLQ